MITVPALLAAGLCVLATASPTPGAGTWPVDAPRVVARFDAPEPDWLAGHRGIDLATSPGQQVRAMAAGVVAFAGRVGGRGVVVVELPDGRRTTYEPVRAGVRVGQSVSTDQPIGTTADGGHCGSRCLHVGLRVDGGYRDPLTLIGRRPAVLKPL